MSSNARVISFGTLASRSDRAAGNGLAIRYLRTLTLGWHYQIVRAIQNLDQE